MLMILGFVDASVLCHLLDPTQTAAALRDVWGFDDRRDRRHCRAVLWTDMVRATKEDAGGGMASEMVVCAALNARRVFLEKILDRRSC